jgi:hypothetical protein
MSRHDEKLVEMVIPSKGNDLAMTMLCTAVVTRIRIALHAAAVPKGRAPASMMMIHLCEEQREAIVVAKTNRRMARVKGVTLCHPHQAAPMVAAVVAVAQQNHTTPTKICRTRSPTMRVPT